MARPMLCAFTSVPSLDRENFHYGMNRLDSTACPRPRPLEPGPMQPMPAAPRATHSVLFGCAASAHSLMSAVVFSTITVHGTYFIRK